jgi:hypothetical protein
MTIRVRDHKHINKERNVCAKTFSGHQPCQYRVNHQIAFKLKIDTFQRSLKILVPNSTMTCLIAQDFSKFIRRGSLPHLFQSLVLWKLVALLKESFLAPLPLL